MTFNATTFLQNYVSNSGGQSIFKLDKRRLTFGFLALGADNKEFFPVLSENEADDIRTKALEWVKENDGEPGRNNPKVGIEVYIYKGTSFVRETSNWEDDKVFVLPQGVFPRDIVVEDEDGEMEEVRKWLPYPSFDMMAASLSEQESEWYPDAIKYVPDFPFGKDVFVLLHSKADPTFDEKDESTWTDYNRYENSKGDSVANYIDYVVDFFLTKEDAELWLQENDHEIGGDYEDGVSVPESNRIAPPEELLEDADLADEWETLHDSLWDDLSKISDKSKPVQTKEMKKLLNGDWADLPGIDLDYLKSFLAQMPAF